MVSLFIGAGMIAALGMAGSRPPATWTAAPPSLQLLVQGSFTPPQLPDARPPWRQRPPFMPPPQTPRYEGNRRLRAAVVGAVGGILAGALAGYTVTHDCTCDSPGFSGIVYGVPIGAALGAAVGLAVSR